MTQATPPVGMTAEQIAVDLTAQGCDAALIEEMLRARVILLRMKQAEDAAGMDANDDGDAGIDPWIPDIPAVPQEQLEFIAALGMGTRGLSCAGVGGVVEGDVTSAQ